MFEKQTTGLVIHQFEEDITVYRKIVTLRQHTICSAMFSEDEVSFFMRDKVKIDSQTYPSLSSVYASSINHAGCILFYTPQNCSHLCGLCSKGIDLPSTPFN